jgi:poly-gamma-glutamate synthesis protein (capsule biosynthesis protein)
MVPDDISFFLAGDAFQARCLSVHANEEDVAPLLNRVKEADAAFMNLEIAIHSFEGHPIGEDKYDAYGQADPDVAHDIRQTGFSIVSRANNHAMDYSVGGLEATTWHLDSEAIIHAGAGANLAEAREPAYLETPKGTVGLVAATTWRLGLAGHARKDVKGRPGVNPLRMNHVYHVAPGDWERLKELASSLGMLPEDHENGFSFPVRGQRFVPDKTTYRELVPNRLDLDENLRAVRDARQLADWVMFSLHDHYATLKAPEGYRDNEVPPRAVEEFAHRVIDEGADMFVGHGPHVLRGIEIYRGKPIFYSLGNWVFQSTLCRRQPADLFEQWGLTAEHSTAELYLKREEPPSRFFKDPAYWESVVAEVDYRNRRLHEVRLIPVHLDYDPDTPLSEQRNSAGVPHLATGERADRILEHMAKLSGLYGTEVEARSGLGYIKNVAT